MSYEGMARAGKLAKSTVDNIHKKNPNHPAVLVWDKANPVKEEPTHLDIFGDGALLVEFGTEIPVGWDAELLASKPTWESLAREHREAADRRRAAEDDD